MLKYHVASSHAIDVYCAGDEWPADEFKVLEPLSGDKWTGWWGKYTAQEHITGAAT